MIPKSSHIEHLKENFFGLKCPLKQEDLDAINSIEQKYIKRYNNPGESWGVSLFEGLDGV